MIRDPSDGSVREKPVAGKSPSTEEPSVLRPPPIAGSSPVIPSGLPPTTDPKEIEKLNRSRDWIKQWNEGRGR
jgi:hypothetical protein